MEHTLPYSWYSDPEILRREQERIFRSAWQYAGHLGQAPEPGTFFATRAGRTPVVVTRARDGELRAFLNVCRHRGFTVAAGEGRREALQCPFCENFLECYHCQVAHPRLAEVLDVSTEAYALSTEGRLSSQRGPIRESGRATMDLEGELPRAQMAFDDQVGREDRELVEGVHRGVASGALEHGVLMGRSEQLIGHFQQLTAAALADWRDPPGRDGSALSTGPGRRDG